jgi:hypothetical protein
MADREVPPELLTAVLEKQGRLSDDIEFALPVEEPAAPVIEGIPEAPEGVSLQVRETGVGRGGPGLPKPLSSSRRGS